MVSIFARREIRLLVSVAILLTVWARNASAAAPWHNAGARAVRTLSQRTLMVNTSKDPQLATQLLIAQKMGYFRQVGLTVSTRFWADGSQMPPAMAAGTINEGQSLESDALTIIGKGAKVKIISKVSDIAGTIGLVVPAGSPIRQPKDLEGKKVAGTNGAYLINWIHGFCLYAQQRCDASKISIINTQPPDVPSVILTKSADAAITFEPYLDIAAQNGAKVLATGDGYDMPNFKKTVTFWHGAITVYVREPFLKQHPDTLVAYLKALNKANAWLNGHKREAAYLLAPDLNLKEPVLYKVMRRNKYGLTIDKRFLQDVRVTGQLMVADHEIPSNPPLKVSVDTSILRQVDPALVQANP